MDKFTLRNELLLLGLTIAFFLIPIPPLHLLAAPLLVFVLPGLACARWIGLPLDWRDPRTWATTVIGSLALFPLIAFEVSLLVGFDLTKIVFSVGALTTLLFATTPRNGEQSQSTHLSWRALILLVLTTLLIFVALLPVVNGFRASLAPLSGAYRALDWQKHYALTWEIETSGLPPRNLFFLTDPPVVHPYYLFFHTNAALLDLMSNQVLGINFWLVACTVLAAVAIMLLMYCLAYRLWQSEAAAFGVLLGITLIGGLDVIPDLYQLLFVPGRPLDLFSNIEQWDGCNAEISNWFTMYTWVPQHLTSLAILLLALLVYQVPQGGRRRAPLIGLLIVSAVGFSIYVPLGALAGIGLHVTWQIAHSIRTRSIALALDRARQWLVAALLGFALGVPLIRYILSASGSASNQPVNIWVRYATTVITGFATGTVFQAMFPSRSAIPMILDLPLYYLLELGVMLILALIGLAVWRRNWFSGLWAPAVMTAVCSLLIRSHLINT